MCLYSHSVLDVSMCVCVCWLICAWVSNSNTMSNWCNDNDIDDVPRSLTFIDSFRNNVWYRICANCLSSFSVRWYFFSFSGNQLMESKWKWKRWVNAISFEWKCSERENIYGYFVCVCVCLEECGNIFSICHHPGFKYTRTLCVYISFCKRTKKL